MKSVPETLQVKQVSGLKAPAQVRTDSVTVGSATKAVQDEAGKMKACFSARFSALTKTKPIAWLSLDMFCLQS